MKPRNCCKSKLRGRLRRAGALIAPLAFLCCLAATAARPQTAPVPAEAFPSPPLPAAWTDVAGKTYARASLAKNPATVFVFTSTQCPVANVYTPRLIELGRDYAGQQRGVRFFLVYAEAGQNVADVKNHVRARALPFPAVRDDKNTLADALGASTTPEAVIVDRQGKVRYRGRIDDNKDRAKVIRSDVRDALDALLAGKPVARPRTLAFGCTIFRDTAPIPAASQNAAITYARDVAPLLDKSCVACHRSGEVGGFSLETYAQAKTWATAIKDYTARRIMPPWKAVPGHGDFEDARALSNKEIATLARWADAGAPPGNLKERPTPPVFPPADRWELGKPDLVLSSPRPYRLAAEGDDVYRQFVLPLDLPDDVYLSGIELKPDNRAVVHHIIAYLDPHGDSAKMDGKEAQPGYTVAGTTTGVRDEVFLSGWAAGNTARRLPPGTALKLSKGAKLLLQVHYHKNGRPEADQSRIGLYFAKGPVDRVVIVNAAVNTDFVLKPGEANQKVVAQTTLPADATVWSVSPHMHLLGRAMTMTAHLPDGTRVPMVRIDDWDFNWQESYNYKTPLKLPKGTVVRAEAIFDNSERNPRQHTQPPKTVRWGEQTTDEMCIGFFTMTVDEEKLGIVAKNGKAVVPQARAASK